MKDPTLSEIFLESLPLEERVRFQKYERVKETILESGATLGTGVGFVAAGVQVVRLYSHFDLSKDFLSLYLGGLMVMTMLPGAIAGTIVGYGVSASYSFLVSSKDKNYRKYLSRSRLK